MSDVIDGLTYQQAKEQIGEPHERVEAARHVLWSVGDPRGYEPGGFTSTLLLAWGRADHANKARLCAGFPLLGVAYDVLWNEGKDGLAAWADANSPN